MRIDSSHRSNRPNLQRNSPHNTEHTRQQPKEATRSEEAKARATPRREVDSYEYPRVYRLDTASGGGEGDGSDTGGVGGESGGVGGESGSVGGSDTGSPDSDTSSVGGNTGTDTGTTGDTDTTTDGTTDTSPGPDTGMSVGDGWDGGWGGGNDDWGAGVDTTDDTDDTQDDGNDVQDSDHSGMVAGGALDNMSLDGDAGIDDSGLAVGGAFDSFAQNYGFSPSPTSDAPTADAGGALTPGGAMDDIPADFGMGSSPTDAPTTVGGLTVGRAFDLPSPDELGINTDLSFTPPTPAGDLASPVLDGPPVPSLDRTPPQTLDMAEVNDKLYDGQLIGNVNGVAAAYDPKQYGYGEVGAFMPRDGIVTGPTRYEVNGMLTNAAQQAEQLQRIADLTHSPVIGVHNATEGLVKDALQSMGDKMGYSNNPATETLAGLVGQNPNAVVDVHSQGGIIASGALNRVAEQLGPEALKGVQVQTFGAASYSYPDGPAYTHHVNLDDAVPGLFGLGQPFNHPGLNAQMDYFHQPVDPHGLTSYLDHTYGLGQPAEAPSTLDQVGQVAGTLAGTVSNTAGAVESALDVANKVENPALTAGSRALRGFGWAGRGPLLALMQRDM